MRAGAAWSDVCILNLSLRGAGLQCASPPQRGAYVEIRRGPHLIVARVAWSDGHRFGVRAQDALPIDAIIAEPTADAAVHKPDAIGIAVERRSRPRVEHRHDHSRLTARAAEFACIAILGAGAAIGLYGMVENALARPVSSVAAALAPRR